DAGRRPGRAPGVGCARAHRPRRPGRREGGRARPPAHDRRPGAPAPGGGVAVGRAAARGRAGRPPPLAGGPRDRRRTELPPPARLTVRSKGPPEVKNRKTARIASAAVACATLLALSGCADKDATATPDSAGGSGTTVVPDPDVNGDGKVIIGVLSPGDINDNGYYESFVTAADEFAKEKGWTVIKRGNVPETEALSAARALCQQKVDMVALGASELKDAIPASEEAVCAKTAWYVPSSGNVQQTPRIMLSTDDAAQSILTAGYAAGLMMEARGATKAAFVAGMEVDFNINASTAFKAGVRSVLPDATVTTTYSGDQDDAAKAREA